MSKLFSVLCNHTSFVLVQKNEGEVVFDTMELQQEVEEDLEVIKATKGTHSRIRYLLTARHAELSFPKYEMHLVGVGMSLSHKGKLDSPSEVLSWLLIFCI